MRAALKAQISPGSVGSATKNFGGANSGIQKNTAVDSLKKEKTDFKSLIINSENEIKKQRQKEKAGDFSDAKTDSEFLEKLQNANKPKTDPKNKLDKNSFLKLFVAQLKNQDPLNPDDGAEMASKLAQFHSLEEMININKNLGDMFSHQKSSTTASQIEFIGKEVEIKDNRVVVEGSKDQQIEIGYEFDKGATRSSIIIKDETGKPVFEKELGPKESGKHSFQWSGTNNKDEPLKKGVYTFHIEAQDKNEAIIMAKPYSKTSITGISLDAKDGGIFSPIGKIDTSTIKSIGLKGYNQTSNPPPSSRTDQKQL